MIILIIIIPKLGLKEQTDSNLATYATEKIEKIDLEPAFAAVSPSTITVKARNDAYKLALGKVLDGTTADTADKDLKRSVLQEQLTLQAYDCARISNGDMVLYLKSGYEAKDVQGSPVGELNAPGGIVFRDYGKNPGELVPDWEPVENAVNYTSQVFTDVANPNASVVSEVTDRPSKAKHTGLTRGTNVWVRVRANGGSTGKGPWSDPANKIVP
jgi:hypothetical protein